MTRNMTFVTWLINQWTLLGNNKRDALIVLFDEYIFLSLATRVFFSGKKLYWFFFLFITNKSFSPDTYYKTTSWINSTVFDSFLGKDWQYTLSIVNRNINDASECISLPHFLLRQFFSNSINIIFIFRINVFFLWTPFILCLQTFFAYHKVSNRREVRSSRGGWKKYQKLIAVGGEAGILGRGVGKNWKF